MKNIKNLVNLLLEDDSQTSFFFADPATSFAGHRDLESRSAHTDYGVHRDDASQINRIHAFANAFLSGSYLDPDAALVLMRSKLNHAGLDFDYNKNIKLREGYNSFQLNRYGEIFGATPTTNLLKDGFDRGKDYIPLQLSFNLTKSPNGKIYFSEIQVSPTTLTDVLNRVEPTLAPKEVQELYDISGKVLVESSDMLASVSNMIMKNKEIKVKVLDPIFKSLMSMKKKKKLSKDETVNRLKFASKSALRRLVNMGKLEKGKADDVMVTKLANSLYKKFRTMETLTSE